MGLKFDQMGVLQSACAHEELREPLHPQEEIICNGEDSPAPVNGASGHGHGTDAATRSIRV